MWWHRILMVLDVPQQVTFLRYRAKFKKQSNLKGEPVCYTHRRYTARVPVRAQKLWFSAILSEISENRHRYLRHFSIGALKTHQ